MVTVKIQYFLSTRFFEVVYFEVFGLFHFSFNVFINQSLREKCPYSEFFWSLFSRDAGIYGPEKLRIQTLFTQ